jgi:hypothetical protein
MSWFWPKQVIPAALAAQARRLKSIGMSQQRDELS